MTPRIKICCIASEQEASDAISFGASAIGLVGAMPSGPGPISDEEIFRIARTVPPPIATFLLTSEQTAQGIIDHHNRTKTNTIQIVDELHGRDYNAIREVLPNVKLVQVVHVTGDESVDEAAELAEHVDAILLDSGNPKLAVKELGGTGRRHGKEVAVDLGSINGEIFVNNSSIGLYPHIVKQRESQQHRLGRSKWHAAFWATVRSFRLSPLIEVRTIVDGREIVERTPFVFIGNNVYEMNLYQIGARKKMDEGNLFVYALTEGSRRRLLRFMAKTLTGRAKQGEDFRGGTIDSITLTTHRKKIAVARDGEVGYMMTPLEYKILPGALRVLVPQKAMGAAA